MMTQNTKKKYILLKPRCTIIAVSMEIHQLNKNNNIKKKYNICSRGSQ